MLAALLVALVAAGVFSSEDPSAATTSPSVVTTTSAGTTSTAAVTTTLATTTTAAMTTTTAATTTTTLPPPLLEDDFDGATSGFALFGAEYMTFTLTPEGTAVLTAVQAPYVLPAMYAVSIGDAVITLRVRTDLGGDGRGGMIVYSEDPSDSAIGDYVLVQVIEGTNTAEILRFNGSSFDAIAAAAIPAGAGFDADGFNDWRITLAGGTVTLEINGILAVQGVTLSLAGAVGLVVTSSGPGDAIVVDDLLIVTP